MGNTNITTQWEYLVLEKCSNNTSIQAYALIDSLKENYEKWDKIELIKNKNDEPKNIEARIRYSCKGLVMKGALEKVEGEKSTWKAGKNFLTYFKEVITKIAKSREIFININDYSNYLMRSANEKKGVEADILTKEDKEKLIVLIMKYDIDGVYYSEEILE